LYTFAKSLAVSLTIIIQQHAVFPKGEIVPFHSKTFSTELVSSKTLFNFIARTSTFLGVVLQHLIGHHHSDCPFMGKCLPNEETNYQPGASTVSGDGSTACGC